MNEILFYILVAIGVAYAVRYYWRQWHGADDGQLDPAARELMEWAGQEGCNVTACDSEALGFVPETEPARAHIPTKETATVKPLPVVQTSYQVLHDMVSTPIRSRLLMAGIELGVFDHLEGFCTADEVATNIDAHTGNTTRFLNALVMVGLLEKKNGRFRNRPAAATFLVRASATYLGDFLHLVEKMCVDALDDLEARVKGGPVAASPETAFDAEERWAAATRVSAGWVRGFVGPKIAGIVAGLPEFPAFRRMLDLGGGHGMFAMYLVAAHPTMTAVVFDRPAVVAVAEDLAQEYGLQDRLAVKAGDYLVDPLGTGYDFVWACSTLNFARHDLDALMAKIYSALNPGGVFISFQDGLTHERTRPDLMLGHLGHMLRTGRELAFDQGEICACMRRCGFEAIQSRTVDLPMGAMDIDIARKL